MKFVQLNNTLYTLKFNILLENTKNVENFMLNLNDNPQ